MDSERNRVENLMLLPLLQTLRSLVDVDAGPDFSGWRCIYIQHILESNISCVKFLESLGLNRSFLRIVGKAYSTNSKTLTWYQDQGYEVSDPAVDYFYQEAFDAPVARQVRRYIEDLIESGAQRILLIDEGGIGATAASPLVLKHSEIRWAVTELTARGAHNYKLMEDAAPIVDVGRSELKKRIEAPIIALSMAENLNRVVFDRIPDHARVGIFGLGAIGVALKKALENYSFDIRSYDIRDPSEQNLTWITNEADLVLSSTGVGLDILSLFAERQRARIFANCGSSDIEFHLWRLVHELRDEVGYAFRLESPNSPWKGYARLKARSQVMDFARGGFPINFDGSSDPILPHQIQLTRAALMAGAVQAINTDNTGVVGLRSDWQQALGEAFLRA